MLWIWLKTVSITSTTLWWWYLNDLLWHVMTKHSNTSLQLLAVSIWCEGLTPESAWFPSFQWAYIRLLGTLIITFILHSVLLSLLLFLLSADHLLEKKFPNPPLPSMFCTLKWQVADSNSSTVNANDFDCMVKTVTHRVLT